MEKELKKMPDYSLSSPNEVEKYVKIWMKDLQDKYDNLSGMDKVYIKLKERLPVHRNKLILYN